MRCAKSCGVCFKQMAAYELRISDWSSDVCSSDLCARALRGRGAAGFSFAWRPLPEPWSDEVPASVCCNETAMSFERSQPLVGGHLTRGRRTLEGPITGFECVIRHITAICRKASSRRPCHVPIRPRDRKSVVEGRRG